MKCASLFTGIGGLDLAVEALGYRVVWQAEKDKHASLVLEHRFPNVPNYGDVSLIDYSQVEPVDALILGGWPCQPFSSAGKRKGTDDDRYLWPEVARAVRALRPRVAFMEQVTDILDDRRFPGVFGTVLGDLAEAGLDARWACLRASDIGAPHRRNRLFLVAHRAGEQMGPAGLTRKGALGIPTDTQRIGSERRGGVGDLAGTRCDAQGEARERERSGDALVDPCATAPHPDSERLAAGRLHLRQRGQGHSASVSRGDAETAPDTERLRSDGGGHRGDGGPNLRSTLTDSEHEGPLRAETGLPPVEPGAGDRGISWGPFEPAIRRWENLMGPAPVPTIDARLNPDFVEWMVGLPSGWTEGLSRTQRLKCCGNIAQPQQALYAFAGLLTARR